MHHNNNKRRRENKKLHRFLHNPENVKQLIDANTRVIIEDANIFHDIPMHGAQQSPLQGGSQPGGM